MSAKYGVDYRPVTTAAQGKPSCCPKCEATQLIPLGTPYTRNDALKLFVVVAHRCLECEETWPTKDLANPTIRDAATALVAPEGASQPAKVGLLYRPMVASGRPRLCPECGSGQLAQIGMPFTRNGTVRHFDVEAFHCFNCDRSWQLKELELGSPTLRGVEAGIGESAE